MKEYSKHWKSSKQPGKQRKYAAKAPIHIKRKMLSANLSKDLRKEYGKRNIPLRKGDKVKVMRGKFKKKQGKITSIDTKALKITIEGVQRKKLDGSKIDIVMQPSNVQIIELDLKDNRRIKKKQKQKEEQSTPTEDKEKKK